MKHYKNYIEEIQSAFASLRMVGGVDSLYEPIRYTIEDGGKRMRPLLCLLSAAVFNKNQKLVLEQGMNAAMALEIFHNFTLLHDDIMDSAPTRRGRPTVHTKWGDNSAILSGDAMMILAYQVLAKAEPLKELLEVFNRAAIEVCEGQQLDMEFETKERVEETEYIEMIRLKTSVLMAAATKMGAITAGATEQECDEMYKYGENLGLAFQIQDDYLDTYGDINTFGKKIGGDIAEGKQTFLRIKALELATGEDKETLIKSRDYDTIKAIYDKIGVAEIAQKEILRYYNIAQNHLDGFDAESCAMLREYSEYLLHRNK